MKNLNEIRDFKRGTNICAFCGKKIGGNKMIAIHDTSKTFTAGFTAHTNCAYLVLQKNIKFQNSVKAKNIK